VVAASEDVDTVQVGDLVAVRPNVACGDCLPCRQNHPQVCTRRAAVGLHGGGGGFSEYVVVDASQAFVMPSGVTPTEAALIEPLSVAWHAVSRVTLRPDATALVVGAGAIGLGVMMALKAQGVEKIAAVEPNRLRQEAARSLGVEVLGDDASSLLDKLVGEYANGFDLVFDASGAGQPVFDAILASLQPGGTAMIVAVYHTAVTWSPTAVIRSEITITGSYGYWDEDYRAVTEAISTRAIDPGLLVTKIVPLHDIVSGAFLHLTEGPGKAEDIKVLVSPAPVPS
jgi:threonine dehydrogenase-like Zn-dependent dehydrogenase